MTYIIDIILAVVFVAVIAASAKKGFFMSLFDLVGSLLSFILAKVVAQSVAPGIYEAVLQSSAENYLSSSLSDVGTTDYVTQIEKALSSIPESLSSIMEIIGIDTGMLSDKLSSVDFNGDNLVESIMNTVVDPVATAIIQLILFVVLAVVMIFVLRIAARLLNKVIKKLPVIKRFNSLFGGIFGVLRGMLVVAVLVALISVIAGFTTNELLITSAENSIVIGAFKEIFASISGFNF